MSIIDKIENIGIQINELYEFINVNEDIKEDWEEYKRTLACNNENKAKSISIPYIFERKLKQGKEDVISIYIKKQDKLSRIRKKILNSFQNFQNTIFEVKKVAKNGFELYNLVNEKTYFVISMVKMTHFRLIGSGDYVIARIIEFENDYYLIELSDAINASQKEACYKFAVSKIMENPQSAYFDNKDKQKVIEKSISRMHSKFIKLFNKDTVITNNNVADEIIEIFNNYENDEKDFNNDHLQKLLDIKPEKSEFYKIESFDIEYNNFIENSMNGFKNNKNSYDVGIIFDKYSGFYAIPFWGTFCRIFEEESYNKDEKTKECILSFLENDKISYHLFENLNDKYPKTFLKRINEILNTNYTFEELLEKYYKTQLGKKIFSPTSILYASTAFNEVLNCIEKNQATQLKKIKLQNSNKEVGRNDLCPCGSGKKYKNCCLKLSV